MNNPQPVDPHPRPLVRFVPLVIILVLLGIRLFEPWYPGDIFLVYDPIYQVVTYAGTAFFIWWKRDQLATFHIDKIALFIIIIFNPLQTLILPVMIGGTPSPMSFPQPMALLLWLIAILLAVSLWPSRKNLPPITGVNIRWLVIGAAVGFGWSFLAGLLLIPFSAPPAKINIPFDITILLAYPYQLGYAAVSEEPLFRGLLWGQLRQFKWREGWIWLTQAALFALAHANLRSQPNALALLGIIFIGGLIMGLLAWKSRSVATSSMMHAFYNASGIFVMLLLIAIRT